ncbi:MAG: hemolysin family protein [Polyangia bacterium]
MLIELAIVFLLILANGVLAGAEMAVVSVRKTRLQELLDEGRGRARALASLRESPERFLATVQIGITVVGTTASAFGGAAVAAHLEPTLRAISWIGPYAHDVALAIVVAIISYLALVFGELVPKSLALRAAEPYALLMSRFLLALSWVARPLVWLLTVTSNVVLKPFADRTTFTESRLSKQEIQYLVEEAAKTGALAQHTTELASRALQFEGLTGADIMVPRTRIVALPRNATQDMIRRCLLEERHARIPVYDGTLDNVAGYVTAKDLLPVAWEGRLIVLEDVLRPAKMFIETTPASQLLQFMQRERQRLAMLVDEHGAIAGLATFEDLVEELVGEVFSEHDGRAADPMVHEANGTLVVRGEVAIRDVRRELGIELEEPDGITTVAGLCSVLAGGVVPQRGARLAARDGVVIEVLDSSPRTVRRARVIAGVKQPEPG